MVHRSIGLSNRQGFPPSLLLTTLFDSVIQMVSSILMHPILVDPIEHNIGSLEEDVWEVCHALGGWCLQSQLRDMVEARPKRPRCLSGVSTTSMVGCRVLVKRHCLSGFVRVGLGVGELQIIKLVEMVE